MDLRIERTKRSIKEAFLKLRKEKPLEKITVKELAELAYINKATFYSHYKDIYDLSEQLEDEIINSIIENFPTPENLIFNARENVKTMAKIVMQKKEILDILFSGNRETVLEHRLEESISDRICEKYPKLKDDLHGKIVLSMLLRGGFYVFSQYGEKYNVDDLMRTIGDINECLVENFIKVYEE